MGNGNGCYDPFIHLSLHRVFAFSEIFYIFFRSLASIKQLFELPLGENLIMSHEALVHSIQNPVIKLSRNLGITIILKGILSQFTVFDGISLLFQLMHYLTDFVPHFAVHFFG